jgi:hypothetical protein
VIEEVLTDLNVLPENVYNIDKTGVMLNILGSVKVLVSIVTAIEYASADG